MSTAEIRAGTEVDDFDDFPLSVDLCGRLVDAGVFGHKAPFFLWGGRLVEKEELPGFDDFRPYRIDRERFEKMVDSGVFEAESSPTLWGGRLVRKMTAGQPHSFAVSELYRALLLALGPGWTVIQEQPVAIDAWSLPEPDVSVVRGTLGDYRSRRPDHLDVGLPVEVSDSSLRVDRGAKLRAYAGAGVPRYWVVNLVDRRVEAYERPVNRAAGPGYAARTDYRPGDSVPVVLDGVRVGEIAVDEVLPG